MIARTPQELRSHILSHVPEIHGSRILDVGCGSGRDLLSLASRSSNAAKLVGLDASATAILEAQLAGAGDPRLAFHCGDVSKGLPYEDCSFDAVLSVNLLECVVDRAGLIYEMHRVLQPGGTLVVAHFDWDSQLFDGDDKALVRRIVHTFADWQQDWMDASDAWMGRRLWSLISESGLFDCQPSAVPLIETKYAPGSYGYEQAASFRSLAKRGRIGADQYRRFIRALEKLSVHDRFLYSITMFICVGIRRDADGD